MYVLPERIMLEYLITKKNIKSFLLKYICIYIIQNFRSIYYDI